MSSSAAWATMSEAAATRRPKNCMANWSKAVNRLLVSNCSFDSLLTIMLFETTKTLGPRIRKTKVRCVSFLNFGIGRKTPSFFFEGVGGWEFSKTKKFLSQNGDRMGVLPLGIHNCT